MKISRLIHSFLVAAILSGATIITGCSKKEEKQIEKSEGVTAQELAEQMEAEREGREAARYVVNNNWPDSMQLQGAILDARAKNSKYEMEGKKKCKERFDSAFYSTIRTVRPDLATQLEQ